MTNYTVSIWAHNVLKHHVPAFHQLYPAYLANLSSIIAALHERCGRITQHKGTCMNKHGFTSIAYAFVFVTPQQVSAFSKTSSKHTGQQLQPQNQTSLEVAPMIHAWQTDRSPSSGLVTRWHESAVEFMLKVRSLCINKSSFITKPFSWLQRTHEEVLVCVYSVNISHPS